MLVSEIMSKTLEFISPDATVQEAATLLGELDVGALPVGSPEDLQGILTDRDILFRVVAEGADNVRTRVRDVMSTTLFSCRDTDTLATAMDIMGSYHVRRLPVLDESGRVVGWVALSDISRRLLLDSGAVRDALGELSASGQEV
ncbi:CBS domain-containing protein [Azospirillum soli]|uniref:CBS domain-containing protein n=1 Tax=Azospirillum soli TaxID=1304799 RepID=UPI001FEC6E33|nr:CBS domain-containing protein [Azospirillum soli]MBP2312848.1 CBS domain-containing protein [Azospirillum soli]